MKTEILLKKLEGIQTIESVKDTLKVNRQMAIYYIYRLRQSGYVKSKKLNNNKKVYAISHENKLGGVSYYEIINANSPIKISAQSTHKIYGKVPNLEETLLYAIKSRSLRTILAALAFFKKINNWSELYHLSKKNHLERQVGALYDLAKRYMKTRKMTKRFRNNALPKKKHKFEYTIHGLSSKDFKDIEKTWKVYLPFNKADMEEYK